MNNNSSTIQTATRVGGTTTRSVIQESRYSRAIQRVKEDKEIKDNDQFERVNEIAKEREYSLCNIQ